LDCFLVAREVVRNIDDDGIDDLEINILIRVRETQENRLTW
jgi:hypothetical protein